MATTKTEVKRRRADKTRGGFTYDAVRRLAGVSERMVYHWYRGERTSAKIARAHQTLTNGAV